MCWYCRVRSPNSTGGPYFVCILIKISLLSVMGDFSPIRPTVLGLEVPMANLRHAKSRGFKLPQLSAALISGRFTHPDWLNYIYGSSFTFSGQSKKASTGRKTRRQWNRLETFQKKCTNNESKHRGKGPQGCRSVFYESKFTSYHL